MSTIFFIDIEAAPGGFKYRLINGHAVLAEGFGRSVTQAKLAGKLDARGWADANTRIVYTVAVAA